LRREAVPRFDAGELGRLLAAPDGGESLSPLIGPGAVVLDLRATTEELANLWKDDFAEALPRLPCVTIAIQGGDDASKRALESACDVVLKESDDLDALLAGFERTPLAAMAFVQLLRSASTITTYHGLVAESFVYSTLQSGSEFQAWLAERPKRRGKKRPVDGPACRLSRSDATLEIELCRPARHNAFSRQMRDDVAEGLQLALADSSIASVVLRGEGQSFCSGGDLDEFGSLPNPAEAHAIRTTRSPALLISRLGDRVRAEVQGACIGAGIELAAFCDRVVAQEDAFFQLPEVGLGLVPGAGGSVSLPRRIGRQKTAWLGLSGARIDAQMALAWGLVDEVRLGQHGTSR
jgi:enoyl-CoA hydratase